MASSIEEQTRNNDYNNEDADTFSMEMLNSFLPKSNFYNVGMRLRGVDQHDLARDAFQRGSETGCIPCMSLYTDCLSKGGKESMIHLRLPWLLEGAIRGHLYIIDLLVAFYKNAEPANPESLQIYWTKILNSLHVSLGMNKEERKNNRGTIGNVCYPCREEDSDDRKFQQCSGCKIYSYCGKECQLEHWNDGNHRGECKQLQILNTYHKPYAKQIHKKITRGDDPTKIIELQTLREKLGLSRPKDEYEKLLLFLGDDCDDYRPIRREYIVARDDGTVHIGSTAEVI
ncbi:hypothetical protein FRACYDRAFT_260266 [Fragilariopsis cylindrus CCMP1102]|uniref:MYND-type domain-containing protein n=1 Tax=Fragilariopsis cylindrus CCMP1102 TaxID=635003 RepID=A0A1E7FQ23_9STRA|nr:hypothetical protein FRACYDRAFT_260266 [Fragilariopsis cylindrus CCMP1102]|eukprot:OEU20214.1 hypothetical protein FRACYDRAFT_260266 [Fragilariopsis cylindrus CCMP1102]